MISMENLFAFWLFAIVAIATPGPNNMLVLAASARVGFVRSMPLVLGIATGVSVLIIGVGLGLGAMFESAPWLYSMLRIIGTTYLLYLAWRIATAGVVTTNSKNDRALGFIDGAVFQLVNPKAWMIALSIVSTYVPAQQFLANVIVLAVTFGSTAIIAVGMWAGFGNKLRRMLGKPKAALWFNRAMGVTLALTVLPILIA
jgi:threonine/homoserine/homoserine lactone efflux protein